MTITCLKILRKRRSFFRDVTNLVIINGTLKIRKEKLKPTPPTDILESLYPNLNLSAPNSEPLISHQKIARRMHRL